MRRSVVLVGVARWDMHRSSWWAASRSRVVRRAEAVLLWLVGRGRYMPGPAECSARCCHSERVTGTPGTLHVV